jgi:hypothetical protein
MSTIRYTSAINSDFTSKNIIHFPTYPSDSNGVKQTNTITSNALLSKKANMSHLAPDKIRLWALRSWLQLDTGEILGKIVPRDQDGTSGSEIYPCA